MKIFLIITCLFFLQLPSFSQEKSTVEIDSTVLKDTLIEEIIVLGDYENFFFLRCEKAIKYNALNEGWSKEMIQESIDKIKFSGIKWSLVEYYSNFELSELKNLKALLEATNDKFEREKLVPVNAKIDHNIHVYIYHILYYHRK